MTKEQIKEIIEEMFSEDEITIEPTVIDRGHGVSVDIEVKIDGETVAYKRG